MADSKWQENIEKRTEKSKTYDNPSNPRQHEWVGHIGAVHYKENYEAKEEWKDIDLAHKIDKGTYWLYDRLPILVRVFKNKVGYEVESRRSRHVMRVELDELTPSISDVEFEFEMRANRVRLWKIIKHAGAKKEFRWKITEENKAEGLHSLNFRETVEVLDADGDLGLVAVTKKQIDENSFSWEEKFEDKVALLPSGPHCYREKRKEEFLSGDLSNIVLKENIKYPVRIDSDVEEVVGHDDDDASHANCGVWSKGTINLNFGKCCGANEMDAGMRFQTVNIDNGATITTAKLSMYCYNNNCTLSPLLKIKGELTGDAAAFSDEGNYNGRGKTADENNVDWDDTWVKGAWRESPEIKTIIKEIVDQATWSANNDLVLFVFNDGGSGGYLLCSAHDRDPGEAAQLAVDWEAGALSYIPKVIGPF